MLAPRFAICLGLALVSIGQVPAAGSGRASVDAVAAHARCIGADTPGGSAARRLQAVSCLVDAVRDAAGEHRLQPDWRLRRSAIAKARDIARCHAFAHAPCGGPWAAGMHRLGYARGRFRVGENLAWLSRGGTPRQLLRLWLASPAHRANLLDRRYRDTGLARVKARLPDVGVVEVWVQQFGSRNP